MSSGSLSDRELGSYHLLNQIAVGGMAEIYLAKTQGVAGFEKFLCLKVLHPDLADDNEFIEMLIDEAKLVVGLNHVNIAQIFDLGRQDDTYYIAMEYVDGSDLFKMMRALSEQDIDVPIDVAAYVAQEICTGLDYAHRKKDQQGRPLGIIHRDISPQNILISHWGEVKIIDFGIAKAASRSKHTQAGVIKGKYYYMSPEQAWGDQVDHRSDIFSAGIILYEVLTGQMLYLEENVTKLMDMVRRAEIPRPTTRRPDIPPQLENVVMKALAKRPADRWQSANDFQVALTSFLYSYSPDFTPERLAKSLKKATDWNEAEELDIEELDDDDIIFHVEEEQLMSRVDFAPVSENSVIFDAAAYRASIAEEEDDYTGGDDYEVPEEYDSPEEKTTISSMPEMMEMGPAHEVTVQPPQQEETYDAWEDDGPTVVAGTSLPYQGQSAPHNLPPDQLEPEDQRGRPTIPHEIVVGQSGPVSLPPRVLPPGSIGINTEEKTLPKSLAPQTPPALLEPTETAYPSPPLDKTEPAYLTPREPTYPPSEPPPGTVPPGWQQRPTPASNPGAPLTPEDSGQQAYTGGAFAQRLAAHTPTTPPSNPARQASPPPSAPAPMPPSEAHPAPSQRVATMALDPTVPAAPVPEYPSQPTAPAPQYPPPPGAQYAPGTLAELGSGAEQLTMQPRGRGWLKALLALILVAAVLGGIATVVFLAVQPAPDESGFLEIVSVPEGAKVSFAGAVLDKPTPVTIPVEDLKAEHKVAVTLSGYQPWSEKVSFPGGYTRLRVLAVLTPVYGKVLIRSLPSSATIYIKGESYGRTPATVENLSTQEDLTIELKLKGHSSATRTIKWEDESYLEVEIPLEKDR